MGVISLRKKSSRKKSKNETKLPPSFQTVYEKVVVQESKGEVAKYIPVLAKIDLIKFGVALLPIVNKSQRVEDYQTKLSIQSI